MKKDKTTEETKAKDDELKAEELEKASGGADIVVVHSKVRPLESHEKREGQDPEGDYSRDQDRGTERIVR